MNEQTPIDQRIAAKAAEVMGLHRAMELHMHKKLTPAAKQAAENEQFRLEFKLKQLELMGWEAKVEAFRKVLSILRNGVEL